jgi:RNA polymerase sigma factor (sigma-70 family)
MLRDLQGPQRRSGLERLSRRYWKPVYCFVRQAFRVQREDARDLTQSFFTWLLTSDVLDRFDPQQGRLRHFLKGVVRNFVRNEQAGQRAVRRGGKSDRIALGDLPSADLPDPRAVDPEQAFDEAWVGELIERATERVQKQLTDEGRSGDFEIFVAYEMAPPGEHPTYESVAKQLGVSANTVRHQLFKIRERIRTEIRAELRDTVRGDEQLEAEWRELFGLGAT